MNYISSGAASTRLSDDCEAFSDISRAIFPRISDSVRRVPRGIGGEYRRGRAHCALKGVRRDLNEAWRAIDRLELSHATVITSAIELACGETKTSMGKSLWGEWLVLRAVGLALSDDAAAALSMAAQSMREPLSPALFGIAQTICRFGYWGAGDRTRFDSVSRAKLAFTSAAREGTVGAFDLCIDAAVQMQHLRFGMAKWMAADARRFGTAQTGEDSAPALIALSLMAQIAYEESDLDRCSAFLRELMQSSIVRIPVEALVRAYPLLARIHAGLGHHHRAMQDLQQGEDIGRELGSKRLMSVCLRERVYWLLARGSVADADDCMQRLSYLAPAQLVVLGERRSAIGADYSLAAAWIAMSGNRPSDAIDAIRQLHREALLHGDIYETIRLGVYLVDVLQLSGQRGEAGAILLELLRTGMGAGLRQSFIDSGFGVRALILETHRKSHVGDDEFKEFVEYLVGRLERRAWICQKPLGLSSLPERILTPRETLVLRLIGGGLSNKRIARDLEIAPETVKSHAKRIFHKLGTRTRAEAITRAVKLCIL